MTNKQYISAGLGLGVMLFLTIVVISCTENVPGSGTRTSAESAAVNASVAEGQDAALFGTITELTVAEAYMREVQDRADRKITHAIAEAKQRVAIEQARLAAERANGLYKEAEAVNKTAALLKEMHHNLLINEISRLRLERELQTKQMQAEINAYTKSLEN
jgi:hypothetical protein